MEWPGLVVAPRTLGQLHELHGKVWGLMSPLTWSPGAPRGMK